MAAMEDVVMEVMEGAVMVDMVVDTVDMADMDIMAKEKLNQDMAMVDTVEVMVDHMDMVVDTVVDMEDTEVDMVMEVMVDTDIMVKMEKKMPNPLYKVNHHC